MMKFFKKSVGPNNGQDSAPPLDVRVDPLLQELAFGEEPQDFTDIEGLDSPATAVKPMSRFGGRFGRKPKAAAPVVNTVKDWTSSAKWKSVTTSKVARIGIEGEIFADGNILTIGKTMLAAGLFWDYVEDGVTIKERATSLNEELKAETKEASYSLFIQRKGGKQTAFGRGSLGHKPGIPVLITALSEEAVGKNWIGIFQVDDRNDIWWLGSIRNGEVFEDQIIRGRMSAEDAFMQGVGAPGLEAIYAPDQWSVAGARQVSLATLIDIKQAQKLRSLHPIRANASRIVLIGLIGSVAIGGLSYYRHIKAEEMRELEEMQRRMRENVAVTPQDLPWYQITRVGEFIAHCEREINRQILIVPGWSSQPISCTISKGKGGVTAGWTRADGSIAMIRSAMPKDRPQPILSNGGAQASTLAHFDAPVDEGATTDLPWSEAKIENWLRERFQNFGIQADMRPAAGNQPVANAAPQFNSTEIRISSPIGMSIYGDLLGDVPALLPDSLIYNLETGNWDLLLRAYHPVIMPLPNSY
ncbi:type 4b pilus protein PilO2 [Paracoccus litorisediminis]|uniref:type 4b pilus protein PilO2 n=1 Tax=Paracoccus litorisediminis TaxID=2006130 RepID=UPI003732AA20